MWEGKTQRLQLSIVATNEILIAGNQGHFRNGHYKSQKPLTAALLSAAVLLLLV